MKKKLLECKIHGVTLHRCKKSCRHIKVDEWASEYREDCFKCISEGRIVHKVKEPRRSRHISFS